MSTNFDPSDLLNDALTNVSDNVADNVADNDNVSDNDNDKPVKKSSRVSLELDCSTFDINTLTSRLCKMNTRDYTHALRNSYKKRPLKHSVFTIQRFDEHDPVSKKLISKSVLISIKNDQKSINFNAKSDCDFDVHLTNRKRPTCLDNKRYDYLYSADNYPVKCALIAMCLRLLKPYHTLSKIVITTKRSLSPDSLVISYRQTPIEIIFRTCSLIFDKPAHSLIATHLILNALFTDNAQFDMTAHLEQNLDLDVLKSLESTVL